MMELEAKGLNPDTAPLDTKLSSQKDFLNRCNTLLECAVCRTRPEYLLLLGLFTQNLTSLCEATVSNYLAEVQTIPDSRQIRDTNPDPVSKAGTVAHIGQYEIDSQQEWNTLVKVLIILQLQSIENLLRGTKEASYTESNSMLPRVQWPCKTNPKLSFVTEWCHICPYQMSDANFKVDSGPTARRVMILIQRLGQPT